MGTIQNGKNSPLNTNTGTLPNVNGALLNWLQPMVFITVTKIVIGGEVVEIGTPINFRGVIQPLSARDLMIKPEGERAWTWLMLHADPSLALNNDDVVTYLGVQTRVMGKKDYSKYGYIEYQLVQDWTGSGPRLP